APRSAAEPQTVTLSKAKEKEFQKVMTERILRPLSSVMRLGEGSQSKLVERLVHAGIRRKGAAEVFLGAKVAIALALPAATAAFMLWRATATGGEVNIKNLLLYCAAAMILGLIMPNIWLSRKAKQRMETIRFALPDALDLLVVCIESGLALDASFVRLAREIQHAGPELAEELTLMNLEVSAGKPREDCLRNFGLRTGVEEAKSLAARIIQTTRFGTNLAHSLRIHAESLRQKRRQAAEERAAKTTVKLLFPLVFFIFPAIFVVILGPAIVNIGRVFAA
ncbi:MAG: type II secretion system F family protein, partial [Candidatus Brocadiia bacterium]|nr:type II secretion system F family protein [Candidatus Brocadiia bacterium]